MWMTILGSVAMFASGSAVAQSRVAARPTCCFANPQYSGVCSVQPAQGETCASVLKYLNDPQSLGKTYCANTTVRGGWKQRKCAPAKTASPSPPVQ